MIPAGAIMLNQTHPQMWGGGGIDLQRISSPTVASSLQAFNQLQTDVVLPHNIPMNFGQQSQQPTLVYLRSAPSSGLNSGFDIPQTGFQTYAIVQPNMSPYQMQAQQIHQVMSQQLQSPLQLLSNPAVQQLTPSMAANQTVAYFPSIVQSSSKKRTSEDTAPFGKNCQTPTTIETKKPKLDSSDQCSSSSSSKILHFKGLPSDVTDHELIQLSLACGQTTQPLLNKKLNEAFLEVTDQVSASKISSQKSLILRGHALQAQLTERSQIDSNQVAKETADLLKTSSNKKQANLNSSSVSAENSTTAILSVSIENVQYPVNVETLRTLFTAYGQVMRIATFNTNDGSQLLVQFNDKSCAEAAKLALNGHNMHPGCNKMKVEFSIFQTLEPQQFQQQQQHPQQQQLQHATTQAAYSTYESPSILQPLLLETLQQPQTLALFGRPHMLPNKSSSKDFISLGPQVMDTKYLTQFGAPIIAYNQGSALTSNQLYGTCQQSGLILPQSPLVSVGSVLLISNLEETKVSPDALFTLFGVYGDVVRVKVMFNKKDTALIQFNDLIQAQTAILNLDKLKLWGKVIKVAPSKHTAVQMPKDGQPDAGLTKDYKNSPLHRFKKPNSKNFNNIFPPSSTLHLSNIPSTSKEKLTELFSEYGTVVGFKFFNNVVSANKECKMALMQMNSIEEATHALIGLHNHQLAETTHLRVSFSKSSVVPQNSPATSTDQQQEPPEATKEQPQDTTTSSDVETVTSD